MSINLLEVKNVAFHYQTNKVIVRAVDGVSLIVRKGGSLGIVGESGSGKSTLGKLMAGLLSPMRGRILFDGKPTCGLLTSIQFVFQNSTAALNPRMRVESLVEEGLIIQKQLKKAQRRQIVGEVLSAVGLQEELLTRLPSQLSGGQKQRVALARTLVMNPHLLILDEPVSSLDVTAGARLLALLNQLRKEREITYILISHDLAVVRQLCEDVAVMYAGKIVEKGQVVDVFNKASHFYTQMLLATHPSPDPTKRLSANIIGEPNDPTYLPSGCRFHPRCLHAIELCRRQPPGFTAVGEKHWAVCHLVKK